MGSVFFETDTEFVNVTVVNILLEGVKFVLWCGRFFGYTCLVLGIRGGIKLTVVV